MLKKEKQGPVGIRAGTKLGGWKSDYAQDGKAGARRNQSWDEAGRLKVTMLKKEKQGPEGIRAGT